MPYNRRPQRAASNPAKRDNSSLSSRAFVRVSFDFAQDHELVEWRRFEGTYRPVFVRPALAREYMNMIMVRKDYSVRSSKPNPCMPGLGQGHGKKDISMLRLTFLPLITLKRHSALSRSTLRPFGPELKAEGLSTGSWPRGSTGVIC